MKIALAAILILIVIAFVGVAIRSAFRRMSNGGDRMVYGPLAQNYGKDFAPQRPEPLPKESEEGD